MKEEVGAFWYNWRWEIVQLGQPDKKAQISQTTFI